MNERIQTIAEMASEGLDPEEFMGASEEFLNRFAELIVCECAEIAFNNVGNISSIADAEWVEAKIKDHFGV